MCEFASVQVSIVSESHCSAFAAFQGSSPTVAAIELSREIITPSSASEAGLTGGTLPLHRVSFPFRYMRFLPCA